MSIARRYDLMVIEDACQAHGAAWGGRRVGSFGVLGCFSFYPTKNLGAYGDGGMVVTDHKGLFEKLRLLRCYGEKKRYRHVLKGDNSRLDEIQAAILRVKLKYLDQWNEERRRKARIYTEMLQSLPVICPIELEEAHPVYHLFVIRTRKRNVLQEFLKGKGIDTLIHYPIPVHLQKAYRELDHQKGDLPLSERCSGEVLSLPLFAELSDGELRQVVQGVKSFFRGTKEGRI